MYTWQGLQICTGTDVDSNCHTYDGSRQLAPTAHEPKRKQLQRDHTTTKTQTEGTTTKHRATASTYQTGATYETYTTYGNHAKGESTAKGSTTTYATSRATSIH